MSEATQEKKRDPNNPCLFCTDPRGVSIQHELAFSARDTYPTSPARHGVAVGAHPGHPDLQGFGRRTMDLTPEEVAACMGLIKEEKKLIDKEFNPDGYNIGVNVGEAAGQSILHVHIHIIPRYKGDVENPQGGVRHVIPKKAHYTR